MGISLVQRPQALDRATGKVRVAFYMRVSTAEQELEGYSPEFQRDQLLDYVKRKDYRGWITKPEWHFFDVGSGSELAGRAELQRLLKLVADGGVDIVLVWKIDRLSRSLSDLLGLFDRFNRHGVGFASMKEDLDFTGPIGRLIYQVFGALAEFERETIKMRTEEGRRASALAGNYTGTVAPYGFVSVPNPGGKGRKLQPVPEEAEVVRQIFRWFVYDRWNPQRIAEELNRLGVPKGKANRGIKQTKWREYTVRIMLGSEEYRGIFITNRYRLVQKKPRRHEERPKDEWIVVRMPAIIDDMLFYMAQERLQRTRRKPDAGGGKEQYMLRGKLVEIPTGRGFVGYVATKGTKNYRRKQYIDADGVRHPSMSIAARPLEEFVWQHIEKAIGQPEAFLRLHRQTVELGAEKDKIVEQLRFYEDQLSDMNRRIERVNEDYYVERIDEGERNEWLAKYKDQREAMVGRKERVEEDLRRLGRYDAACESLREFATKFHEDVSEFTYAQKKALVEMLVERVEVSDDAEGRKANVLFRFDPKEIAASMNGVEPGSAVLKPKFPVSEPKTLVSGANDREGYFLFSFQTPVGYLGNNQHRQLRKGHRFAAAIVRARKRERASSK